MNGYIMPDLSIRTAYGPVAVTHPDLNDLWGDDATVRALLALSPERSTYARWQRDQLSAHIVRESGRLYVHRIDTDPWAPPVGMGRRETLRLMDKLCAILKVNALAYSPQYRGLGLIDRDRKLHPEWFDRELPPNWDERDTAITPNFTRKQSDYKIIGTWRLHKWDTVAAWLASACTTPVGFGAWRRLPKYGDRQVGIFPVKLTIGRANPSPITFSGWYATETVRAAIEFGESVEMASGQGWDGHATALRPFCELLYRARAAARYEGKTPEEVKWLHDSIKRVYTRTFGALDKHSPARPNLHQPHWYYLLRAESARRIWQKYNSNIHWNIGIHTDAIYAIAPANTRPREINSFGFGPHDGENPGTMRYEGSTILTRALYDMFGQPASEISRYLEERKCLEPWGAS